MFMHPHIDPVALHLGPLQVHWYGLMYLLGFLCAWYLATRRCASPGAPLSKEQVPDLIFYCALGVLLGGRLGYMVFYNAAAFWRQPWILFQIWQGGMSFHGGLLGVVIATVLYAKRYRKGWIAIIDFVAPLVPLGLAAGRLGNFINGELWGRVTTMPWGMVFPGAGPLPRHPSQLYECALEGVLLFVILWRYSAKPRPSFAVSALFLLLYGLFRFTVEFFRQPDPQWGTLAWGWLTMGQVLSFPMILIGLFAFMQRNAK